MARSALEHRDPPFPRRVERSIERERVPLSDQAVRFEGGEGALAESGRRGALLGDEAEDPGLGRRLHAHLERARGRHAGAERREGVPEERPGELAHDERAPLSLHARLQHRGEHLRGDDRGRSAEADAARSVDEEPEVPAHRREDHLERERSSIARDADERALRARRDEHARQAATDEVAEPRRHHPPDLRRVERELERDELPAAVAKLRDAAAQIDGELDVWKDRADGLDRQRTKGEWPLELDAELAARDREPERRRFGPPGRDIGRRRGRDPQGAFALVSLGRVHPRRIVSTARSRGEVRGAQPAASLSFIFWRSAAKPSFLMIFTNWLR